ncbi:MAG: CHASE2 domain-containing protein [Paramuribaculum sp.]|nr:CHASE2 domain-containing protein [Paramuribaculum sp.]
MKKFISNRWGDFAINFTVVITFTLALSWLLDYDPYSLFEGTSDFNSGDYYDRVYHHNHTLPLDTNITIVPADNIPNDRLPDVLRRIAGFGAKAIGFDLIFRNESSITDELIDVIDSLPQIVMPVSLTYDRESGKVCHDEHSLLDEYLDGKIFATVTFPPRSVMSYQREFYIKVPDDGDSIGSFAFVLARMIKPDLVIPNDRNIENINFNISEVDTTGYNELYDSAIEENIKRRIFDKIVLVGEIHNGYDVHPTAVDDEMPGIKIHAAAISTLLSNRPLKPLGKTWTIIFIIVCVAVVTIADAYFADKDDFRKGIAFLGIKGVFLVLMLVGGYALYIYCGVRSDFTYSITLFLFSMMIADLWFGFRNYLTDRKQNKKK